MDMNLLLVLALVALAVSFAVGTRAGLGCVCVLAGLLGGFWCSQQISEGRWGFPNAIQWLVPLGAACGFFAGLALTRTMGPNRFPHLVLPLRLGLAALVLCGLWLHLHSPRLANAVAASGWYRTAGLLAYAGILPQDMEENALLAYTPKALQGWVLGGLISGRDRALGKKRSTLQSHSRLLEALHQQGQGDLLRQAVPLVAKGSTKARENIFQRLITTDKQADNPFASVLFANGASPDMRDSKGTPLLVHASRWQHWPLVQRLLAAGANPALTDAKGLNALSWAVMHGNTSLAEQLIAMGLDPLGRIAVAEPDVALTVTTITHNKQGATLLHLAAFAGAPACVPLLLRAGVAPNMPDAKGLVPAFYAAVEGGAPLVRLLAAHGLDANRQDAGGLGPLHTALVWRQEAQLPVPVRYSLNLKAQPQGQAAVLDLLLTAGADTKVVDSQGRGLMHYAAAGGLANPETIQALMDAGARADLEDHKGRSPLAIFARRMQGNTSLNQAIEHDKASWEQRDEHKRNERVRAILGGLPQAVIAD